MGENNKENWKCKKKAKSQKKIDDWKSSSKTKKKYINKEWI